MGIGNSSSVRMLTHGGSVSAEGGGHSGDNRATHRATRVDSIPSLG
jgi:hypothetical protein